MKGTGRTVLLQDPEHKRPTIKFSEVILAETDIENRHEVQVLTTETPAGEVRPLAAGEAWRTMLSAAERSQGGLLRPHLLIGSSPWPARERGTPAKLLALVDKPGASYLHIHRIDLADDDWPRIVLALVADCYIWARPEWYDLFVNANLMDTTIEQVKRAAVDQELWRSMQEAAMRAACHIGQARDDAEASVEFKLWTHDEQGAFTWAEPAQPLAANSYSILCDLAQRAWANATGRNAEGKPLTSGEQRKEGGR